MQDTINMVYYKSILVLAWIGLQATLAQDLNLVCPTDWLPLHERCYLPVSFQRSWSEASIYCQHYGAYLAKPTGFVVSERLTAEMTSKGNFPFWTDYTSDQSDHIGAWSDDSKAYVEHGVWAPYEPDLTSGNCAYIGQPWDSHDDINRWYMGSCSLVLASMCEMTPCPSDTFRCHNGKCVYPSAVCNNKDECGDFSDEMACPSSCRYTYYGSSGTVQFPEGSRSSYQANAHCLFAVEGPVGTRIRVQFDYFDTEILDVLEILDVSRTPWGSTTVTRMSGSTNTDEIRDYVSSSNSLRLRFTSDSNTEKRGFKFRWNTNFICSYWRMRGHKESSGQAGYTKSLTSEQTLADCEVRCTQDATCWGYRYDVTQSNTGRTCYIMTAAPLPVENSCCDLFVKTCPGITDLPTLPGVPSLDHHLTADDIAQDLYTPLYPFHYLGNTELTYTITSVYIQILTLQVIYKDLCCGDYVTVHDGNGPAGPVLATLNLTSSTDVIMSTGNVVYIYMYLKQHMRCRGLLMTYKSGCDVEINKNSGVIASPGWDVAPYPGITTCSWLVRPDAMSSLTLTLTDLDTEDGKDFVKLFDGESQLGVALHSGPGFHGNVSLGNLTAISGRVFVKLTTNAIGNNAGFRIWFSSGCTNIADSTIALSPTKNTYQYPDVVSMACTNGYYLDGAHSGKSSLTIRCDLNGNWDVSPIPHCKRGNCARVKTIVNGHIVMSSGIQGGDYVVYACTTGYTLTGQSNVTCRSDNQWETRPTCTAKQCSNLTAGWLNHMQVVLGNGTDHETVVNVTCPKFFEHDGPETLKCDDGVWEERVPQCQNIRCRVPEIPHALVEAGNLTSRGTYVFIQCESGYELGGSDNTFQCGIDEPPVCVNVDECSTNIHQCENATCEDTEGLYICHCKPGYTMESGSQTRCIDIDECDSKTWAPCDDRCNNTPGSYQCGCDQAGYVLFSGETPGLQLNTGEDGHTPWDNFHIGHTCVPMECNATQVLDIPHGQLLTTRTSFFYGETVSYLCDMGYTVNGGQMSGDNITCTMGLYGASVWSRQPQCSHYYVDQENPMASPNQNIKYGEIYRLECNRTNQPSIFLESHVAYIELLDNYDTIGDVLKCPETDCGAPPVISGTVTYAVPCTHEGCSFPFECRIAYDRLGNSSSGDNRVYCDAFGLWGFGDIHCKGGQCEPPGHPVDGFAILNSTEEGSELSYGCNRPGHFPSPNIKRVCVPRGITLQWSGIEPVCTDQTKPNFTHCPSDFVIHPFGEALYNIPEVFDNIGLFEVVVIPRNFLPKTVLASAVTVHYTALDYSLQRSTCYFTISITDTLRPYVTCTRPPIQEVTSESDHRLQELKEFYSTDDANADVSCVPPNVNVTFDAIGTTLVTCTARDPSNNSATCKIQLEIAAPKCHPLSLRHHNADTSCTSKPLNQGYDCNVTCQNNYVFFDMPNVTSMSVSCFEGDTWLSTPSKCTPMESTYMQPTLEVVYDLTGPQALTGCADQYRQQLEAKYDALTSELTIKCQTVNPNITVNSPGASPVAVSAEDGILMANLTFVIQPSGLPDTDYQECAIEIYEALYFSESAAVAINTLNASSACPVATIRAEGSVSLKTTQYVCDGASQSKQYNSSHHVCLSCPHGTYKDAGVCTSCPVGTYNDQYGQFSCSQCPANTLSFSTGLTNRSDCYQWCAYGLHSPTGRVPCVDCPADTYWVNGSLCSPCPSDTHTNETGALSINQCIAECAPGQFSSNGLAPCRKCPRSFYQPAVRTHTCKECAPYQTTAGEGSWSAQDCISATTEQCPTGRCQNGAVCSVIRHIFFCNCTTGYTGRNCETFLGPCHSSPCAYDAKCEALNETAYTCQCTDPATYSGDRCEIDIDDCASKPCKNNGTCIDEHDGYRCTCASYSGFTGTECEIQVDPCAGTPCHGHGACIAHGSYYSTCNCTVGFTGLRCETNIDECANNPCINGGTCTDGDNAFTCACVTGYMGKYCHLRDYSAICPVGACQAGSTCVDDYVRKSKFCYCPTGSEYDRASGTCLQIDSCSTRQPQCSDTGMCISIARSYSTCKCNAGYAGPECRFNLDDCINKPCLNGGTCVDGVDDFTCVCPTNGTGGRNCSDVVDNCKACVTDQTDSCIDRVDAFLCQCKTGYTGTKCETRIPSCQSYPCQHQGTCSNPNPNSDVHECACPHPWTGLNCETEIDYCATGQECKNDGQCFSSSGGFVCVCGETYVGTTCETEYDLCARANPCNGPNGVCVLPDGVPVCQCEDGYTGASCETLLWICTDSTCLNGGTCSVDDAGLHCSCSAGYTGSSCEENINDCVAGACPTNAKCEDEVNAFNCVCNPGKVGDNCEKDYSQDFDYVILPSTSCRWDDLSSGEFTLESGTEFSILFWMRFDHYVPPGIILSLYGGASDWSLASHEVEIEFLASRLSIQLGTSNTTIPITSNLGDGLWHHVALTWESNKGDLYLYTGGQVIGQAFFGREAVFPSNFSILLGKRVNADGIVGTSSQRISRVNVFNKAVSKSDVGEFLNYNEKLERKKRDTRGFRSILQEQYMMSFYTKDYNSELSRDICTSSSNCWSAIFNSVSPPNVSCPNDTTSVHERVSKPSWKPASFRGNIAKTSSSKVPQVSGMGWGIYGISYAAYDESGNAGVCSFRFFNMRYSCEDRDTPSGLRKVCLSRNSDVCSLQCVTSNTRVGEPAPRYQSCSMYGMGDQHDRPVPYPFPTCSQTAVLTFDLHLTMLVRLTPSCSSQTSFFLQTIRTKLSTINQDLAGGLCKDRNDVSDAECKKTEMSLTCSSQDLGRLQIDLTLVQQNLTDANFQPINVRNYLLEEIADENLFANKNSEPQLPTLSIVLTPACKTDYQVVQDMCVKCPSGTFYDTDTRTCVRCPIGTYGTGETTECSTCPSSKTTNDTGAVTQDQCYQSCFRGRYLRASTGQCEDCPVGFYMDHIGAFWCDPCPYQLTTQDTGANSHDACIAFSLVSTTPVADGEELLTARSTEDGGLTVGEIVAIVFAVLVAIAAIVLVILFCIRKKLPCFADANKVQPASTSPLKFVNRYGDTNIRFVNYRLSDIKEHKGRSAYKIPIYPAPPSPDSVSMRTEVSVNVPIFMEILDGKVSKNKLLRSKSRSYESIDLDQDSERQSTLSPPPMLTPPRSHTMQRHQKRGRRPADLTPNGIAQSQLNAHPRSLPPMRKQKIPKQPLQQSELIIRPLSGFERPKPEVTKQSYEEILGRRPSKRRPLTAASKSSKITVDSDEEDYR